MPSPTKTPKDADELEEFNELDDVDPLAEMRKHYVPDPNVPSPPTGQAAEEAYDPRHIEDMEADYEGQHSSREERRNGQYGEPQSYHVVPSPSRIGLEEERNCPAHQWELTLPRLPRPSYLPGHHIRRPFSQPLESTQPPRALRRLRSESGPA